MTDGSKPQISVFPKYTLAAYYTILRFRHLTCNDLILCNMENRIHSIAEA